MSIELVIGICVGLLVGLVVGIGLGVMKERFRRADLDFQKACDAEEERILRAYSKRQIDIETQRGPTC